MRKYATLAYAIKIHTYSVVDRKLNLASRHAYRGEQTVPTSQGPLKEDEAKRNEWQKRQQRKRMK